MGRTQATPQCQKRKAQEEPAAEPEDEVDDLAIELLDAEGLTGQLEADAADEDGGKVAGATLGDFLDDDELPEGITEEALKSEENVDLSSASLSLVQAQRVAQLLASNDALASIKFDGHTVDVESMRTDEELEWDSEDYCDVEAIIIAELLKQEYERLQARPRAQSDWRCGCRGARGDALEQLNAGISQP